MNSARKLNCVRLLLFSFTPQHLCDQIFKLRTPPQSSIGMAGKFQPKSESCLKLVEKVRNTTLALLRTTDRRELHTCDTMLLWWISPQLIERHCNKLRGHRSKKDMWRLFLHPIVVACIVANKAGGAFGKRSFDYAPPPTHTLRCTQLEEKLFKLFFFHRLLFRRANVFE